MPTFPRWLKVISILFFLGIICCVWAIILGSKFDLHPDYSGIIELTVTPKKKIFNSDEKVLLLVTYKNISSKTMEGSGYWEMGVCPHFQVTDETGNVLKPTLDAVNAYFAERKFFRERTSVGSTAPFGLMLRPGESFSYDLPLAYWVEIPHSPQLQTLNVQMEKFNVWSEPITVTIAGSNAPSH